MDQILALARKLGEAVAKHERCTALRDARKAYEADPQAKELQQEFERVVTDLQRKLATGEPLEPEEKKREAELRDRVTANECIVALVRAEADFTELMQNVNEAMYEAIDL